MTGFTNLESDPTLAISHLERTKNHEFTAGNYVTSLQQEIMFIPSFISVIYSADHLAQ
jgi:hypothetical protein